MRNALLLMALLALALVAAPGYSQAPGPGAPSGMDGMQMNAGQSGMEMMATCMQNSQDLGLTDDQMRRIRTIQIDTAKRIIPISANIQVAQVDLMQMLMQDNIDMSKVEGQVRKIAGYTGDLYIAGIRSMVAVRDVLTPEQRKKVEAMQMGGQGGMQKGCGCPCCAMQGMGGMGSKPGPGGAQPK